MSLQTDRHTFHPAGTDRTTYGQSKKMKNINLANIPDESYPEVREIIHEMEEVFNTKKHMLESEYVNIVKVNDSARDVIEAIKQSAYSSILFVYRLIS